MTADGQTHQDPGQPAAGEPPASIDVWLADVSELGVSPERLLTADEQERARRYVSEPARDLFVASRALQRVLGGRYLGRPPEEVCIGRRCALCQDPTHGRPYLVGGGPDFSVSHSGTLVALAYITGHRVGVDVEALDRRTNPDDLAEHVLAPAERSSVTGLPDFLRLWTRKEATVKLTGHGLTAPLPAVSVTGSRAAVSPTPDGWPTAPIWLSDLNLGEALGTDRYIAAVACTAATTAVTVRRAEPLLEP